MTEYYANSRTMFAFTPKRKMKIDHSDYWLTHKKILREEMDKLDEVSFTEIANDPYCQSAMDLRKKVNDRLSEIKAEPPPQ